MKVLMKNLKKISIVLMLMFTILPSSLVMSAESKSSIHPDLVVPPESYGPEVIEIIEQQINSLKDPELAEVPIHIPDYKFVYKILQTQISEAVTNYIVSMDLINQIVVEYLSQIKSLEEQAKVDSFFNELIEEEIAKRNKKVNTRINRIYSDAIRYLYLLSQSSLEVKMRDGKNQIKRSYSGSDVQPNILAYCRTSACTRKITEDIAKWVNFVSVFNQEITITEFDSEDFQDHIDDNDKSITLSNHLAEVSASLIQGTLEVNDKSNRVISYLGRVFQYTGGVTLAVANTPILILEKTFEFSRSLLSVRNEKIKLELHDLSTFSSKSIMRAINKYEEKRRDRLPTVLYSEKERSSVAEELEKLSSQIVSDLIMQRNGLMSAGVIRVDFQNTRYHGKYRSNNDEVIGTFVAAHTGTVFFNVKRLEVEGSHDCVKVKNLNSGSEIKHCESRRDFKTDPLAVEAGDQVHVIFDPDGSNEYWGVHINEVYNYKND